MAMSTRRGTLITLVCLVSLGLALSACGRRGALDQPNPDTAEDRTSETGFPLDPLISP